MFQYAAVEPDRVLSHLAKICYEHRGGIMLRTVRFAIRVHDLHYSSNLFPRAGRMVTELCGRRQYEFGVKCYFDHFAWCFVEISRR